HTHTHTHTGVISLSRSLHGKANTVIPVVISAQDGSGLMALVNARVNISVVAGLVAPPVFEQGQYYFTVTEDALRGTEVGVVRASSKSGECRFSHTHGTHAHTHTHTHTHTRHTHTAHTHTRHTHTRKN